MVSNEEIRRRLAEKKLHLDRPYKGGIKDLSKDNTVSSEELKKKYSERMQIKKEGYLVCDSCEATMNSKKANLLKISIAANVEES